MCLELEGVFADRGVPACVGRSVRQVAVSHLVPAESALVKRTAHLINPLHLEGNKLVVQTWLAPFGCWVPDVGVIGVVHGGPYGFTPCAAACQDVAVDIGHLS